MKGIVLAGGPATRLRPPTAITSEHPLPADDKPMVYYPVRTLFNAGIREIMVVTRGNSAGHFPRPLKNGPEFGLRHLNDTYREGEGGIAAALDLCEDELEGRWTGAGAF